MTLEKSDLNRTRLITVVAATIISLACGTNYIYSAWAPQFAQKLKLSATESNLIGTFGNLGMYASGVPFGMMVDAKGPKWGVALGTVLFGAGYYPIAKAYDAGPGAYGVAILCMFSFFTGAGSCSAFQASIKAAALNYPESRGTATAFPLAAFGLSALFFAGLAQLFPHGTSNFLLLLATGTVVMPAASFFFLRVVPVDAYESLHHEGTQALHRRPSEARALPQSESLTTQSPIHRTHSANHNVLKDDDDENERSSLLSTSSEEDRASKLSQPDRNHESPKLDIRGFALLPLAEFWQLFSMLGLLTGIGLMTINNIGNDAQALWRHYDSSVDSHYIESRQIQHVSILSFFSFAGRLLSGIGSDVLVKFNRSRFWCVFVSASIFSVAQLVATMLDNPKFLFLISGLTGLAYGFLFGVYPSLVAHAFGVNGLSQNWGTMTLAPVISGNIFNIMYGQIFDSHSGNGDKGVHECLDGRQCYSAAYWVTFFSGIGGIALCLWSIWHENQIYKKGRRSDHDRIA